jgi:hypothetical protein
MPLTQFKNLHAGQDMWVVGSDASLSTFPDGFFDGRLVIGVNRISRILPVTYTVTKGDREDERGMVKQDLEHSPNVIVFCSEHQEGFHHLPKVKTKGVVLFRHANNKADYFDADLDIPTRTLLVSQTTAGTALHLAAWMGARTVFCVGLSGGSFDGRLNVGGYRPGPAHPHVPTMETGARQMQPIADKLNEMYGTMFVTVLPWANLRLGGTRFDADYGTLNGES